MWPQLAVVRGQKQQQRSKHHNSLKSTFLKLSPALRSREMGKIILISHHHVKKAREGNAPMLQA